MGVQNIRRGLALLGVAMVGVVAVAQPVSAAPTDPAPNAAGGAPPAAVAVAGRGAIDADSNLNDNVFLSPGWGQGQVVANNAESAVNYDLIFTFWVCAGINYTGSCTWVRGAVNFDPTYRNNVESLFWV